MRYITLFAFATLLALPMQAQVIFESGFEDWTGNAPDGWLGIRTSVGFADSVSQESTNPHTGNFAVRLQNPLPLTADHRRFTTQPVLVDSGETYIVTFWARGFGDIRLGMFDGRPGNGYSPYTGYTTVATGGTWQQYSLTRTAAMNTDQAEFILSIKSTIAPDHLIIDDVNISSGSAPSITSIYAIQFTTDPGGASPLVGQTVNTGGVVSATVPNGFWIQNGAGPWRGVFVFSTQATPVRGDSVRFTASVVEFDFPGFEPLKETQLSNVSDFVVVSSGNPVVTTPTSTTAVNTEAYEGVLVQVNSATCTDPNAGFGQFVVNDGSGACFVDDLIYAYTAQLGTMYDITGPVKFANQEYKITPRDANDVSVVTSIDELASTTITMYPNPASEMLTLELDQVSGRTGYVISDINGRVVANGVLTSDRTMIAVDAIANGSYVLTLRNNASVRNLRLAVQH